MRVDYGNEYFEGGRTVMDFFGSHVIVCNAQSKDSTVAVFRLSSQERDEISSGISRAVDKFSGKPLEGLPPDEAIVFLSLGRYEKNHCKTARFSLSDLSSSNEIGLYPKLLNLEMKLHKKMGVGTGMRPKSGTSSTKSPDPTEKNHTPPWARLKTTAEGTGIAGMNG